jgi:hypothetical protein
MDIFSATWSELREDNSQPPPNGFSSGEDSGDVKLTMREVMAAMKREWNLSHPTLTVGGDGDVITLTPTTAISGYATGQIFAAKLNADLGAAGTTTRTLNVSAKGAKKLYLPSNLGGYQQTAQGGKEAKSGQAVFFAYDATLDSGSGGFVVSGVPQQAVIEAIEIPLSGENSAPTASGTPNFTFRLPYAFLLTGAKASLKTAQTSGTIVTAYAQATLGGPGDTLLFNSPYLTIDNTETTSLTAATPVSLVSGIGYMAADTQVSLGVAQVGDGTARGLKVTLLGYQQ